MFLFPMGREAVAVALVVVVVVAQRNLLRTLFRFRDDIDAPRRGGWYIAAIVGPRLAVNDVVDGNGWSFRKISIKFSVVKSCGSVPPSDRHKDADDDNRANIISW
jgi:hypothetical protein